MVYTEIDIYNFLSDHMIDKIILEAERDCKMKMCSLLGNKFDISGCTTAFEFICKVNVTNK